MAVVELIMPKMGESIMEATILNWVKNVGDTVELDETILEIATDKVDSEIPSPVEGVIQEIYFEKDAVVEIGTVIAKIATEGEDVVAKDSPAVAQAASDSSNETTTTTQQKTEEKPQEQPKKVAAHAGDITSSQDRFYSPLVKSIAAKENIGQSELDSISGSGSNNRVTKSDILGYVENRTSQPAPQTNGSAMKSNTPAAKSAPMPNPTGNVEIIEMDRMRKLIADHMVMSKSTSPHVTSFVEADVTNLVNWRNKVKIEFQKKYGEKITFTPIFIEAIVKAIRDFPMINVSVNGTNIIKKNDINVGMATALPSGNLIVPVIKNADTLNLLGITKAVNGLANKARNNKLKPEEIQGGTFTMTNVGTFGNVMGTPIINQPQVAIMATGAIIKKPAVVETEFGDLIAVRQKMFLSLSYDHRVVDGFLGGSFLRKVADYLEQFDHNQQI